MAETSPLRRRMIEDMTIREVVPLRNPSFLEHNLWMKYGPGFSGIPAVVVTLCVTW